jgi:hypothetical protein
LERLPLAGRSVSTASAEKNLLGFRARASRISSLASGRGGPRYCGGQLSGLKTGAPPLEQRGAGAAVDHGPGVGESASGCKL